MRPYLEGVVGLKEIYTEWSIAFDNGSGSTTADTDNRATYTLGFGAGLDVLLASATDGSGSGLFATIGVRRLGGGHVTYSRTVDSSSPVVAGFGMPTDTTIVLLGVAIHGLPGLPTVTQQPTDVFATDAAYPFGLTRH